MRNLRKLFMVAALAVAAMAFSASSASAILPVELMNQAAGGVHCPAVDEADGDATGGCHLFANSPSVQLIQHQAAGDMIAADCINNYEVRIDENGEGWVESQLLSPGTPNCGVTTVGGITPCTAPPEVTEGEEPLWHLNIEHDGDGNEVATAEFCIDDRVAPNVTCEWEGDTTLGISDLPGNDLGVETLDSTGATTEAAHFSIEHQHAHPETEAATCNFVRSLGEFEIRGHWTLRSETSPSANIRIEHL